MGFDDILGGSDLRWRGYKLMWDSLSDCATIICDKCKNSSTNGGSCEKCNNDFDEFLKLKTHLFDYLNEDEKRIFRRIEKLIELIPISISYGHDTIDWKDVRILDELSKMDREVFKKELSSKVKKATVSSVKNQKKSTIKEALDGYNYLKLNSNRKS